MTDCPDYSEYSLCFVHHMSIDILFFCSPEPEQNLSETPFYRCCINCRLGFSVEMLISCSTFSLWHDVAWYGMIMCGRNNSNNRNNGGLPVIKGNKSSIYIPEDQLTSSTDSKLLLCKRLLQVITQLQVWHAGLACKLQRLSVFRRFSVFHNFLVFLVVSI